MKLPGSLRRKLARDRGWLEAGFLELAARDPRDLSELAVRDPSGLASCTADPRTFVDCARSICARQGGTVFGENRGNVRAP